MLLKNNIRTTKRVARKASSLLRNSKSPKIKSVAGSDLVNRKSSTTKKKK